LGGYSIEPPYRQDGILINVDIIDNIQENDKIIP
jgi:hypothetical protein